LLDTWHIHSRIVLYLLDAVPPKALAALPPGSRTRTIGSMFAHIHNIRLAWLGMTSNLAKGLSKIKKERTADKKLLRESLEASGEAMARLIDLGLQTGKVRGFKPHPTAFVGYVIAHEPYHHGEVCLALTHAGFPLDKRIAYGMWEWGKR
jgi:uncharacterized damage-inducible protein DinB